MAAALRGGGLHHELRRERDLQERRRRCRRRPGVAPAELIVARDRRALPDPGPAPRQAELPGDDRAHRPLPGLPSRAWTSRTSARSCRPPASASSAGDRVPVEGRWRPAGHAAAVRLRAGRWTAQSVRWRSGRLGMRESVRWRVAADAQSATLSRAGTRVAVSLERRSNARSGRCAVAGTRDRVSLAGEAEAARSSSANAGRGRERRRRRGDVRLLGAGDVRAIAARLGVQPTKRLGQNFVVEPGTVRQIAALAGPFARMT